MKLRKYRAATEAEAFRQIRAELGPDAIVIASKPVRQRGVRGFVTGRQEVEVTAVADLLTGSEPAAPLAPPPAPLPPVRPSRTRHEYAEIRASLDEITSALHRLSHSGTPAPAATLHENLRDVQRRLTEQALEPALIDQLIAAVQTDLAPRVLADQQAVADYLNRWIQQFLPEPQSLARPPGGPVVIALIGPTGVGKTTTIAKLAARFALLERQSVALVTIDTFRIAAAEQLATYARIMDLPLEVAYSAPELAEAIGRHRDKQIILVDTPGRSQHHAAHLRELQAYLQAVPGCLVYLTIDACTRHADMLDVVQHFAPDRLDGLIVTKLDETNQYGTLLNLAACTQRPLVYLTTGQEVPDDLETASAQRVANLVLGGVQ